MLGIMKNAYIINSNVRGHGCYCCIFHVPFSTKWNSNETKICLVVSLVPGSSKNLD